MSNEAHESGLQPGNDGGPSFEDFAVPTYEEWRKAAEATLKGAPFEKRLVTKTYEGIDIQPLYHQSDAEAIAHLDALPGFPPYVRGTEPLGYRLKPWEVCQELPYSTPEAFNDALRSDLERGQTAVNLLLDQASLLGQDADRAEAEAVGRGGVSISSLEDLGKSLDRVDLEQTPVFVQAGASGLEVGSLLLALVQKQGRATGKLNGCVGADPLGELARKGSLPLSLDAAYDRMASMTAWAAANAPDLQTVLVQGHPYNDGGCSATQELAFTLATAVDYIRALQARELAIDDIGPRIRFAFSVGGNFFMEVAKLRAARLLWAKIVGAFGGSDAAQKMFMHARTALWNKTFYDPYVNMLRTTTEAFSGVLAGCDSMHVGAFDEFMRVPDEFSRRIARNTHVVLREECNLPRTVDPAGGSWYLESLTDSVAKKSWEVFREIEKQGGMFQALQSGVPQTQVAQIAGQRTTSYARRKDIFIGTNMYANALEEPLEVTEVNRQALQATRVSQLASYRESLDESWRDAGLKSLAEAQPEQIVTAAIRAAAAGATLGELSQALKSDQSPPSVEPVAIRRGAEPYEQLRQASEAYAARTGSRPKVFLANMGPVPQHKARADFSTGFLQVGAFEVISNQGFATPEEAVRAAIESQASVVVICSTDKSYPELVPPLTKGIKEAKPETLVLLAGYPADQIEQYQQAGVDDFIHVRANCYELLRNIQTKLGVAS